MRNNLNKRITRAKKALAQKLIDQNLMKKVHSLENLRVVNRIATFGPESLLIDGSPSFADLQHEDSELVDNSKIEQAEKEILKLQSLLALNHILGQSFSDSKNSLLLLVWITG